MIPRASRTRPRRPDKVTDFDFDFEFGLDLILNSLERTLDPAR